MMYTEKVIEEFTNPPQNVGELTDADGVGEAGGSPTCGGDTMKIYLKVEGDRIADARFRTFGCAAAIASSSMATRMILGMTLAEAWNLSDADVGGRPRRLPGTEGALLAPRPATPSGPR